MTTNEKKLREQVERTLEKERQAREEKKRQIAAIYAEIAAADTVAVGLAFRCYAWTESGNAIDEELAKVAFASAETMRIYEKLNNIAELEYRRYGK